MREREIDMQQRATGWIGVQTLIVTVSFKEHCCIIQESLFLPCPSCIKMSTYKPAAMHSSSRVSPLRTILVLLVPRGIMKRGRCSPSGLSERMRTHQPNQLLILVLYWHTIAGENNKRIPDCDGRGTLRVILTNKIPSAQTKSCTLRPNYI